MCSEGSSLPSSLKIPGTLAIDSRRMRYKGATKCQKRTALTGQSCRKATFSLSYCIDVADCHLSCWWHTMLPQCCEAHTCNSPESAGMRRGIHMRYVVVRSSQTSNLITHHSSSGGNSSSIYRNSVTRISVVSFPLSTSLTKCASTCICT